MPMLWPWGSIDATEKPLPPPAPAEEGDSVCLPDVMGFSKSSRLVYTGCGKENSFLVASEATKLSFSADVELLPHRGSLSALAACDGFTSAGGHEEGCGGGTSCCCGGALGATAFFLNSELAAAGEDSATAGETADSVAGSDDVAGSDSGLLQTRGSGALDSWRRHCEAAWVLWLTEDGAAAQA